MNENQNDSVRRFKRLVEEAKKEFFSGWDFSWIVETRRMGEQPLKWNYVNKIVPYLWKTRTLLDMGTGGGELLSSLNPLPKNTFATETYRPNVLIAKKRLEPLGIRVVEVAEKI